jgi:hypothetical protein
LSLLPLLVAAALAKATVVATAISDTLLPPRLSLLVGIVAYVRGVMAFVVAEEVCSQW